MPPKITIAASSKGQKSLFSFFNKANPVTPTPDPIIASIQPNAVSPKQDKLDNRISITDDQNIPMDSLNQEVKSSPSNMHSVRSIVNRKVKRSSLIESDDEEWDDEVTTSKLLSKRNISDSPTSSTNDGVVLKRLRTAVTSNAKLKIINYNDDKEDLIDSESSASFDDDDDDDDDDGDDDEVDDDHSECKSKNKRASKKQIKKGSVIATKACVPVKNALKALDATPTPTSATTIRTPASGITDTDNGITPSPCPANILLPEGVVGLGSHEHNTYEWLIPANRRDKDKRSASHPDYNHRTCFIPDDYLKQQTPAMVQWWKFKSENMDTVLFFKVGKFYELFHMDADVGMSELDLIYMKGVKAHSGFPEVSYGKFAAILVSRGYRVARVEQTETPDMLKTRNDQAGKGGKKDKVVTRELCSVMSKGTRTYCHLDDLTLLATAAADDDAVREQNKSLLMCIKEKDTQIEMVQVDDNNVVTNVKITVPEYGICCIDTVLGVVTLAQFQDDQLRTRLRTMMAQYIPSEVLLERNKVSSETLGTIKLVAGQGVVLDYLRSGLDEMPDCGGKVVDMIRQSKYFCSQEEDNNKKKNKKKNSVVDHDDGDDDDNESSWLESWPEIMRAVVAGATDGSSALVLCAFGGAIWQLRRSLIDYEVISMRRIHGYVPPDDDFTLNTHHHTPNGTVAEVVSQPCSSISGYLKSHHNEDFAATAGGMDFDSTASATAATGSASACTDHEGVDTQQSTPSDSSQSSSSAAAAAAFMTEGPLSMTLDAVALANLEILQNNFDHTERGSLWSFVNRCKTAFGARLLKTWICHPLHRIQHIRQRCDAVEELLTAFSSHASEARNVLKNVPDLERLLARVHSNGLKKKVVHATAVDKKKSSSSSASSSQVEFLREDHPDTRAVMFEDSVYSSRKIKDFIDVLNGFENVIKIANIFNDCHPNSSLLRKIVKSKSPVAAATAATAPSPSPSPNTSSLGKFPVLEMKSLLKYYREIFDEKEAKVNGCIKPKPGVDSDFDEAKADIDTILKELDGHLRDMKKTTGLNDLKYWGSNKDRYQIEVEMSKCNRVPSSWTTKSQKKTHRRYRTDFIEEKLAELQEAEERVEVAQKDTLRKIFEKFDDNRHVWNDALTCVATLDALLSIACVSATPSYTWPVLLPPVDVSGKPVAPTLDITDGRHPMLECVFSQRGESYIPNTVRLGGCAVARGEEEDVTSTCMTQTWTRTQTSESTSTQQQSQDFQAVTAVDDVADQNDVTLTYNPRLLLLSGPNMGGKSTLLRQTCLIAILAQAGFKVPAAHCVMTPIDRIFTRVGASDRILAGQSTFFVELAETANMLKSATKHSLCILDELGRGTATFDGTAIAHAVVEHLITQSHCCTLFATHYHSLIDDWEMDPRIKLGHMECFVQDSTLSATDLSASANDDMKVEEVTFLFQLRDGSSPRSYGINVARLAGLPADVIVSAMKQSLKFEELTNERHSPCSSNAEECAVMSTTTGVNKDKRSAGTSTSTSTARWGKLQSYFDKLTSIASTENYTVEELASYAHTLWQRYGLVVGNHHASK